MPVGFVKNKTNKYICYHGEFFRKKVWLSDELSTKSLLVQPVLEQLLLKARRDLATSLDFCCFSLLRVPQRSNLIN